MSDCAFLRVRLNWFESESTFSWVHQENPFHVNITKILKVSLRLFKYFQSKIKDQINKI